MKIFFLVFCLATFACVGLFAQFTSRSFERTYEGTNISTPADVEKLEAAIIDGLTGYNWSIVAREEGKITAKYEKNHGKNMAMIEIPYSADGYSVIYVDSKGLDVDLKKMKIHRNYVRWILNLIKAISIKYTRL